MAHGSGLLPGGVIVTTHGHGRVRTRGFGSIIRRLHHRRRFPAHVRSRHLRGRLDHVSRRHTRVTGRRVAGQHRHYHLTHKRKAAKHATRRHYHLTHPRKSRHVHEHRRTTHRIRRRFHHEVKHHEKKHTVRRHSVRHHHVHRRHGYRHPRRKKK